MVIVWRKAGLFDEQKAGVATWVFTIARNLRIDRARKSARAVSAAEFFTPPEESEASGEDLALASEREKQIRAAMDTLSAEQQAVLRLSFFAEKPHAEIARELGIPLGTVKSRVRLAMAKIRALLEERDDLASSNRRISGAHGRRRADRRAATRRRDASCGLPGLPRAHRRVRGGRRRAARRRGARDPAAGRLRAHARAPRCARTGADQDRRRLIPNCPARSGITKSGRGGSCSRACAGAA